MKVLAPVLCVMVVVCASLEVTWRARRETAPDRVDVVLIVADSLRADRLSIQGGPAGLTPHLDALARRGLRFAHANAQAPWTLPSVASLLTSLHPTEHGAGGRAPLFQALMPGVQTLPQILEARGYTSHAVVNVPFLHPGAFGITRDFDTIDYVSFERNDPLRDARATTDAALRWFDGERSEPGPFFLLVHYFDPHATYSPPAEFRAAWAAAEDRVSDWTFGTQEDLADIRDGLVPPSPSVAARAERLYNGEVAHLDAEVGRLLAGLAERGLAQEAVVVFTADHGEEFLEHGDLEHGHSLYEEVLHVPLIVCAPGLAPRVVGTRVRLIDVAPTICELIGVQPPTALAGESLLALSTVDAPRDRPVLGHGHVWKAPLWSWTEDGYKLIQQPNGVRRMYDLRRDPREQHDLATADPKRVSAMSEALARAQSQLDHRRRDEAAPMTRAQRGALAALGYGSGDVRSR